MGKSQFEQGWEACRKAFLALVDERYEPLDITGNEIRELARKLKMPKPTVAKDATVPAAVNYVAIYCELYKKAFGTDYVFLSRVDGRALPSLKEAFPAGKEALYRQVLKEFFKDSTDIEIHGDERGFRQGVGYKMRLLPDRIQKYIDAIQAEDEDDDAPAFDKGSADTLRGLMK